MPVSLLPRGLLRPPPAREYFSDDSDDEEEALIRDDDDSSTASSSDEERRRPLGHMVRSDGSVGESVGRMLEADFAPPPRNSDPGLGNGRIPTPRKDLVKRPASGLRGYRLPLPTDEDLGRERSKTKLLIFAILILIILCADLLKDEGERWWEAQRRKRDAVGGPGRGRGRFHDDGKGTKKKSGGRGFGLWKDRNGPSESKSGDEAGKDAEGARTQKQKSISDSHKRPATAHTRPDGGLKTSSRPISSGEGTGKYAGKVSAANGHGQKDMGGDAVAAAGGRTKKGAKVVEVKGSAKRGWGDKTKTTMKASGGDASGEGERQKKEAAPTAEAEAKAKAKAKAGYTTQEVSQRTEEPPSGEAETGAAAGGGETTQVESTAAAAAAAEGADERVDAQHGGKTTHQKASDLDAMFGVGNWDGPGSGDGDGGAGAKAEGSETKATKTAEKAEKTATGHAAMKPAHTKDRAHAAKPSSATGTAAAKAKGAYAETTTAKAAKTPPSVHPPPPPPPSNTAKKRPVVDTSGPSPSLSASSHAASFQQEEAALYRDDVEDHLSLLSNFADVGVPYWPGTDTAVFWHVPKAAGTTLEDALTHCVGLVEANEIGITDGHGDDQELDVITVSDGGKYVNVDTTTLEGIKRAGEMGFAEAGLADVAFTGYLFDANSIFSAPTHRAKCFTMLRHPVRRAVSFFYYLKTASWETTFSEELSGMSIEEYAQSRFCEDNWMTRMLNDRWMGVLSWHHLDRAKEVLRRKCVIGLLDRFEESLDRYERYFGWKRRFVDADHEACQKQLVMAGDNANKHPTYEDGSDVWELLKKKNGYDIMLYEYALGLYEEQTALIP